MTKSNTFKRQQRRLSNRILRQRLELKALLGKRQYANVTSFKNSLNNPNRHTEALQRANKLINSINKRKTLDQDTKDFALGLIFKDIIIKGIANDKINEKIENLVANPIKLLNAITNKLKENAEGIEKQNIEALKKLAFDKLKEYYEEIGPEPIKEGNTFIAKEYFKVLTTLQQHDNLVPRVKIKPKRNNYA